MPPEAYLVHLEALTDRMGWIVIIGHRSSESTFGAIRYLQIYPSPEESLIAKELKSRSL